MTTVDRTRLTLDPDGVPVALVDIAGDVLDATLWGAARTGGVVGLVFLEDDFFTRGPVGPPTAGQLRALADALDVDDEGQPAEGSRCWWKAAASQLEADCQAERERSVDLEDRLRRVLERLRGTESDHAACRESLAQLTTEREHWLNADADHWRIRHRHAVSLDAAHLSLARHRRGLAVFAAGAVLLAYRRIR